MKSDTIMLVSDGARGSSDTTNSINHRASNCHENVSGLVEHIRIHIGRTFYAVLSYKTSNSPWHDTFLRTKVFEYNTYKVT